MHSTYSARHPAYKEMSVLNSALAGHTKNTYGDFGHVFVHFYSFSQLSSDSTMVHLMNLDTGNC